jgi:hypothetical protein
MAMRHTSIRWNDSALEIIQKEAERDGVTTSEFIRQATLIWAFYRRGVRGEERAMEELRAELREFLHENGRPRPRTRS